MPYRCYAATLHPTEPKLLALEEQGRWALLRLSLEESYPSDVEGVNTMMAERYGLPTTVLSCLAYVREGEEVSSLFLLELHGQASGGRWLGLDELPQLELPEPGWYEILATSLREAADPSLIPPLRAPWARRGWFKEAESWVLAQLAARGRTASGAVQQVKQWSITSLLRVPTPEGQVYFKAVPTLFANEAGITRSLAERFPERVPAPLVVDPARSWMLLEDFGGTLLREAEMSAWPQVIRQFAELQLACADHVDALLVAGCLDRRASVMKAQLPSLLNEAEELGELTEEERARLGTLEPKLHAMLEALRAYAIPDTLVHGDFHSGNIALSGEAIFFDWTDAAIAHPFFDLLPLVRFHDAKRFTPEAWEETLTAYLEPWTLFEPMPRLREAYELAMTLALVYHAISYQKIREGTEPSARWELGGTTALLLRWLLTALPD